jgi:LPS-assembly lipoprotein
MKVYFGLSSFRVSGLLALIPPPSSLILLTAAALLLSGCGFHLRGEAKLPFDTMYVQAAPTSLFATKLRRAVSAGSQTKVIDDPKAAEVTLQLVSEQQQKVILSFNSIGTVSEFRLIYATSYRLTDRKGIELIPTTTITLQRDFSFTDTAVVSKEAEEALYYRDMQNDAVQQLLRRLQATKIEIHS